MKYFDTFKEVHRNYFNRKMKDFDTFKKLPKNVCNLGKIIVATGFEKFPKVQLIAQSGHTPGDLSFKMAIMLLLIGIQKLQEIFGCIPQEIEVLYFYRKTSYL